MVAGLSSGRALLWVAAATAAGALVIACDRLPPRWRALGLLAATRGRRCWRRSSCPGSTSSTSSRATGTSWSRAWRAARSRSAPCGCRTTAPTRGRAPRSRSAARCCSTLSALLACWPRAARPAGYPFLALVGLLVLVVSPVVSLGGTRPLLLGAAIAALTVCFLWLERLPLRPGPRRRRAARRRAGRRAAAGRGRRPRRAVVRLQGVRRGPRARRPGPLHAGTRTTGRSTGRATATRSCASPPTSRTTGRRPTSRSFDGTGWNEATPERGGDDFEDELREDWRNKPGWQDRIEVSVRRMRTLDVAGARHDHGGRERDAAAAPVRRARPLDGELGAAARRLLHGRGLRPDADGRRGAPGRPDGLPRRARRRARDHRAVPAGAAADGPVGRRRRPTGGSTRRSCTSGRSATTTSATSPTRRSAARATTRSTSTFRRSPYARTWELAKRVARDRRDAVRVHPARQQLPARRRVRLLRAAAAAAGRAARRSTPS